MPWLLDGSNLARGEAREAVRRAALAVARLERIRILVFFDGIPPGGVSGIERLGAVEVRYAPNADDAIVAFLGQKAKGWRVATDDRELRRRVLATGAEVVSGATFWRKAAGASAPPSEERWSDGQTHDLEQAQGAVKRLPDGPARIPRRRSRLGRR